MSEQVFHLLTAIYDVAGELIRESAGVGRTGFVRHMDGYICLVDPAQMHLEHSFITKQIPDEERVLSKLHLMTKEEQISIQRMSNQNGKQVMSQDDFLVERTVSDEYIMSGRRRRSWKPSAPAWETTNWGKNIWR